jgi:hypothetical protein
MEAVMPKITHVKSARIRKDKDGNVKPNHPCERCSTEIKVGDSYKHVSIKTGPSSSRTRIRCASCPEWHVWELSNSLSSRLAQIVHDFWEEFSNPNWETVDDVKAILSASAEAIQEIAEEKRESAQNIEDGFGHPTSQSEELEETADALESWADSVENSDITELDNFVEDHPGEVEADENGDFTEEAILEAWRAVVQEEVSAIEESPY